MPDDQVMKAVKRRKSMLSLYIAAVILAATVQLFMGWAFYMCGRLDERNAQPTSKQARP
jgi:Tfp pilus assembly protein PilO